MAKQQPAGRILVVDDQATNIELLHNIFKEVHEVEFAMTGEEALEMAIRDLPDIILLDIQLPGMDGFEVCRRLKSNANTRHIPVIFLTAKNDVDDMVNGYKQGAVDYVIKPFNWFELIAKVNTQLVLREMKSELRNAQEREELFLRQIQLSLEETELTLGGGRPQTKQRVLIVDDSVSNIETLASMLGDEYELFFAVNGEQAKQIAREAHPHLIMLDVVLPDTDGYQVCKQLKREPETRDIPIVFVTSRDSAEDETRGLEAGAIDYIIKPYSHSIVKARTRNLLELVRNRDLLKKLTLTDALTGVPNRRNFQEVYRREWFRACRAREPLSLIMIDIDNFKRFNDFYGHPAGDACLQKVAKMIYQVRKRNTDFVARLGGEEFVVILPDTDAEGGQRFADAMLNAVRKLAIAHEHNDGKKIVTISAGLVTCYPGPHISRENLLSTADECLYQAKKEGRNRVCSRMEPPDDPA
ncbi:PleD family two-component system response regulator [Hahella aquimaris]|uniref:PleD family two-component system response regulator n=1 Tax=Hahella sp. HNIBRBA332 TaxID=3015983 RepID=UPI00273AB2DD|nr:PleD family two-component system response regulator [Hahella sp. HNIBRBA332]WLQ12379.1 PleD family two-component system response regulator [Hahella sp. HNIBRBA332]